MYFIKVKFDRRLGDLQQRMQKLMDEMLNLTRPILPATGSGWVPEADMYETESDIFLIVNLAGVDKEDIEVSFYDHFLSISGRREPRIPRDIPVRHHLLEMGSGSFERIFRIPALIDPENIEASLQDGLLTIQMKKKIRRAHDVVVKIHT